MLTKRFKSTKAHSLGEEAQNVRLGLLDSLVITKFHLGVSWRRADVTLWQS